MEQKNNINTQIFDQIADLLSSSEFKFAQDEFFENNCSKFESQEENKHIYKQIYEEYTQILDNCIEAKLQEKFNDNQIQAFFGEFEQNYKTYKNQDIVEVLFSFTDFEKFKELMLQYNSKQQSNNSNKQQQVDLNKNSQQNDGLGVFQKYYEKDLKEWKVVVKGKTENDLHLYSIPYENTGLDLIKVVCKFENVSLETISEAFYNISKEKMKNEKRMKEMKILEEISPNEKILYVRAAPPVITDREMIVNFTRKIYDNKVIIIVRTIDSDKVPKNDSIVRAEMFRYLEFTKQQNSNVIFCNVFGYQDFKGYIPKMFMNMFMAKIINTMFQAQYKECLEIEKKKQTQK